MKWFQLSTLCICRKSYYTKDGTCNKCEEDRTAQVKREKKRKFSQDRTKFKCRGKVWDSKAHKYVFR